MQRIQLNTAKSENIKAENQIATAMILEIISNKKVKSILKKISSDILTTILNPIKVSVYDKNISSIDDLSLTMKKSIELLALQNISIEEPFGAVLKGFKTVKDITSSMIRIRELISAFETTLKNIDQMDDVISVLKLLKSIADLSFCYFEYFKDYHSPTFNKAKDMIWLTPEECDGRILRSELEQKPLLALTYGISTIPGVDLVSASEGIGVNSGKAVFAGASLKTRLEIIAKQYDEAVTLSDQIKREIDKTEDPIQKEALRVKEQKINEERLKPALAKMLYYHIRLIKSERNIRHETTFEKLVKVPGSKKYFLPLVANISRSAARTLISIMDINALQDEKGQFDLEAIQIFSNCVMSLYVRGGHHSFSEVAEIYNRLLDYIAIYYPKQLPKELLPTQPVDGSCPYMLAMHTLERHLPYYHIGNYESFLHDSYAGRIYSKEVCHRLDVSIKNIGKIPR